MAEYDDKGDGDERNMNDNGVRYGLTELLVKVKWTSSVKPNGWNGGDVKVWSAARCSADDAKVELVAMFSIRSCSQNKH